LLATVFCFPAGSDSWMPSSAYVPLLTSRLDRGC
jgi:hypothetical protein